MPRGNLIVIEGIDGAGTTTQTNELRKRFMEMGLPVHATAQPSSGPVGMLIRQVLSGRLVMHGSKPLSWTTMALLFAADRQDHQDCEIGPNLRDGITVISDRYYPSSVIYQSISSGLDDAAEWIRDTNRFIIRPDVIFNLKVAAREATARRQKRTTADEIYDDLEFQGRLAEAYENMAELVPGVPIVDIDGSLPVEEISEQIWKRARHLRVREDHR